MSAAISAEVRAPLRKDANMRCRTLIFRARSGLSATWLRLKLVPSSAKVIVKPSGGWIGPQLALRLKKPSLSVASLPDVSAALQNHVDLAVFAADQAFLRRYQA